VIPTVLLIALVGAILFPHHWPWVGIAATVVWAVIFLFEGPTVSPAEFLGSVALGAANAAVAIVAVWAVRRVVLTD
jgi:hypothetical protein